MNRRRRFDPVLRGAIIVLMVLLGAAAGWWIAQRTLAPVPSKPQRPPAVKPLPAPVRKLPARPPGPVPPQAQAAPPLPTAAQPAEARVAVIFDDAGGKLADVEDIIAIGRPVIVAVLPGLAHSAEVARRARAAGLEVLLHLPVEPNDSTLALGPGGVTVSMDDAAIEAAVRRDLASVPGAIGVNNHMGSRGTADQRVVRAILVVVKERGLFFLDSVTTPESVVLPVAAEVGVRAAARTVFLDNVDEEMAIRSQVQHLIALARARGTAIAIGHATRLTPRVVASMLDEFDRQRVMFVPLSTLVH